MNIVLQLITRTPRWFRWLTAVVLALLALMPLVPFAGVLVVAIAALGIGVPFAIDAAEQVIPAALAAMRKFRWS